MAFDTVRRVTLLEKLSQLDIPDHVYNWLVNFFLARTHCTRYQRATYPLVHAYGNFCHRLRIGLPLCPLHNVVNVNAANLNTVNPGNIFVNYADDTYLIIPSSNIDSTDLRTG